MKRLNIFTCIMLLSSITAIAQTKIAQEQIEDAFLLKSGGKVFGTITAATSAIHAATFEIESDQSRFYLKEEPPYAIIRSKRDLLLDPTFDGLTGGVIVPATLVRFQPELGDKIEFYNSAYKIGVSPFDLDITSDRNIKFHSDTVEDLVVISGDQGDMTVREDISAGEDIRAGNAFAFTHDSTGDKILLFGTAYKIGISANAVDFYSDRDFKWHSDSTSNALILDGDTGQLTMSGPIQLDVITTLPAGSVGEMVYLDHPTDNAQDGVYVYNASGWQKL